MPRSFYKDSYGDVDVDPDVVGYSDRLDDVNVAPQNPTHRHPVTGQLCDCHYGGSHEKVAKVADTAQIPMTPEAEKELYVPDLRTDVGRRIYKQDQKVFRADGPLAKIEGGDVTTGPKTLEMLDHYAAGLQVPEMLPWLATQVKKGKIKPEIGAIGGRLRLSTEDGGPFETALRSIADWFAAKQSPFRQGKNISEMNWEEVLKLAGEHSEWAHSKKVFEEYQKQIEENEAFKREQDQIEAQNTQGGIDLSARQVVDLPEAVEAVRQKIQNGEIDDSFDVDLDPEKYKGWRVVRLTNHDDTEFETAVLNHCIGSDEQPYKDAIDQGYVQAFSLRDPQGVPKVAFHFNSDGSLAHLQGRSGNPKQEFRDMISIFNYATDREDDGGGDGEDYVDELRDAGFGYQGETYVNLGEIDDAETLMSAYEDPYEHLGYDVQLADDAEIEADVNVRAIVEEVFDSHMGWSEPIMRTYFNGTNYIFSMSFQDYLDELVEVLKEKWEENYYGEYYDEDAAEPGEDRSFNIDAVRKMNEVGDVDSRLLMFLEGLAKPGEQVNLDERLPLNKIQPAEQKPSPTSTGEVVKDYAPDPTSTYEPYAERKERQAPARERVEQLVEQGIVETEEEHHKRRPRNVYHVNDVPLNNSQPIWTNGDPTTLERAYEKRIQQVEGRPYMDVNQLWSPVVMPRDNPKAIAEEYMRIMNTEGQQAANDWYYKNYPQQQPSTQQLTSNWNDAMRWRG